MIDDDRIRAPERLTSGIAGLDTVLSGGFLRSGIYIIRGKPGGGKTILGNQIAFAHVAHGGKALYVTVLAESHARMLQHLSNLSFFDPSKIPESISYLSAFRELDEDGLKGLLTLIRREITRTKATVLILDGLVSVGEEAPSTLEFKKFIHELQAVATLTNCTMFLLTSSINAPVTPEQTMVEGIVDLNDEIRGALAVRTLEVSKFRGSRALRGRHTFRITQRGLVVHPRFEALYGVPSSSAAYRSERVPTGVKTLDEALGGGLPLASSTIVFGTSGTGKTSLGLQFLAADDEPGLLFGFYETPERLRGKARALGLDFDRKVESGQIQLLWNPTTEVLLDELGHELMDAVRTRGVKRLVIDAFGALASAVQEPERLQYFYSALANELRALGVTTYMALEAQSLISPTLAVPHANISSVAENMIVLQMAEVQSTLRHTLSIFKIRDSAFDPRVRELLFSYIGIRLGASFGAAEQVLTGAARGSARSSGRQS